MKMTSNDLENYTVVCFRDGNRNCHVYVNGMPLRNNTWIADHSPTGFEWNYSGSGPAQLAACVLGNFCSAIGYEVKELQELVTTHLYQEFKWRFIANMKYWGGSIHVNQILKFLEDYPDGKRILAAYYHRTDPEKEASIS